MKKLNSFLDKYPQIAYILIGRGRVSPRPLYILKPGGLLTRSQNLKIF